MKVLVRAGEGGEVWRDVVAVAGGAVEQSPGDEEEEFGG